MAVFHRPIVEVLPRFLCLYAALFAAFGAASPFLPAFLGARGLRPGEIGLILAAGTAIRLLTGPLLGRTADVLEAPRAVLALCTGLSALVAFGYLPAAGLWLFLLVSVMHAAVLAPLTPLSDALSLASAGDAKGGFPYGWVRGAGSAAFIVGALLSGQLVGPLGLVTIIWLNGVLLGAAALCAAVVPDRIKRGGSKPATRVAGGFIALLRLPAFRRLMLVAALILGSHALHDSFMVILWRDAGIPSGTISVLWSESVAAEVVVFFLLGRPLVNRLGAAGALSVAAAAGVLRWGVLARTTSVVAGAMVEPLHGLTFALLHLACMRLLTEIVPPRLAATAQAIYATLAGGVATALLTLVSGPLFERLGGGAFWVMAALCIAALPAAWGLRRSVGEARPSRNRS
jgi:MFS transporter, PPP family, 3-phenylpropionic acid transporter